MKETKFKYKYGKYNKPNKKVDTEDELLDEDIEDIDDFFSFS